MVCENCQKLANEKDNYIKLYESVILYLCSKNLYVDFLHSLKK